MLLSKAGAFRRSLGPGLIWAATSIGVSHLVQSTRAGADAGFALVAVIAVALLLKYPFFEYGTRYAIATGESLIEGYSHVGRWALWLFLAITLATAVISLAALALFLAYLTHYALGVSWPTAPTSGVLLALCGGVMVVGRYQGLDRVIKVLLLILVLSTIAAVVVTLPRADYSTLTLWPADVIGSVVSFGFLLALVGWMPAPVDVSVWSSLWTLAKQRTAKGPISPPDLKREFCVGYLGTGLLALCFVTIGATVLYGSGVVLNPAGAVFSTQLVDLYGTTLGSWSRPVVLVAAIAAISSSLLAITDGFPRSLDRTITALRRTGQNRAPDTDGPTGDTDTGRGVGPNYWYSMLGFGLVAFLIVLGFSGSLRTMLDFATTVAFLTAPLLGYLNLRAVTSSTMPTQHQPGPAMRALTWTGLALLGGTGVGYLVTLFR